MTADHWTHHDPAVRELIRAAQAEALRDAAAVLRDQKVIPWQEGPTVARLWLADRANRIEAAR